MLNRRTAVLAANSRQASTKEMINNTPISTPELFGSKVFNRQVMHQMLPKEVYQNVIDAMESRGAIRPEFADAIALAMKEWAINHGATHYTHWFQPLTGASAEKHDAFLDWGDGDTVIDEFSGKQLIQGEPDASSFPSGGLRSTYEARGYTGWDPTSPVFLLEAGDGVTLCIPSVFFSWTGEVLDAKIPLLRSDKKLNAAVLRLLHLTGIQAERVYSTLGLEQEYFVIDRSLRNERPDLLLLGKTVYGALPSKGQELQDHYLGAVKDRILAFMRDFENEALKLGIPVKTRHNEVAPAQHEVAPIYENASRAVDHNILLMELMRHVAVKHGLACLLHEKPFQGLNGSGKHCNWSVSTDTGINLLDPSDAPGNNFHFLVLLTAILHAVHKHSALLRAAIGSASNDYRLGGHEAPPAIISVYLGEELETILGNIERLGSHDGARLKTTFDLGLLNIASIRKDTTDRNRTSPFAFTGNKFEFRAVGSSANPALPATVLNAIVAESVTSMVDEIEKLRGKKGAATNKELIEFALPVIRKYIKQSKPIRFSGDNYTAAWKKEAATRKLPILERTPEALQALISEPTLKAFTGILTAQELKSRYEIAQENYIHVMNIEINLMLELFQTQVLPAAIRYQKTWAKSIAECRALLKKQTASASQFREFKELNALIEKSIDQSKALQKARSAKVKGGLDKQAKYYATAVVQKMEKLRQSVDMLETLVDDALWPLPKYRELLFLI